jgi:putative flippase GtrA
MAWSRRSIPVDGYEKKMSVMIRQTIRFGTVGLANTSIGLLAIYGVIYFFKADPVIANTIGYTIGMIVSFCLNRRWTFDDSRPIIKLLPRYIFVVATSYLLNLLVVWIGTRWYYVGPYLIQLFGISIYTILMFLGCKLIVFSKNGI